MAKVKKRKKPLTQQQIEDCLELLLNSAVNLLSNIQRARSMARYARGRPEELLFVLCALNDVNDCHAYEAELLEVLKRIREP